MNDLLLFHRSNYIRQLIHVPDFQAVDPTFSILPADTDIDDYDIIGLLFCQNPEYPSHFTIWKAFAKIPPDTFTLDYRVDLLYVEVRPPAFINAAETSGVIKWYRSLYPARDGVACLQLDEMPDTTLLSDLFYDIGDTMDFAFFEASTLSMQCQDNEGIYISGALANLGRIHFSSAVYNNALTLKAEMGIAGARTGACIDDYVDAEIDGSGRMSTRSGAAIADNPPHVLLGVPCPPFWGVVPEEPDSLAIEESTGETSLGGFLKYKGGILTGLYKIALGIAEAVDFLFAKRPDGSRRGKSLFVRTMKTYFRATVLRDATIEEREKYLKIKKQNKIRAALLGTKKLQDTIQNSDVNQKMLALIREEGGERKLRKILKDLNLLGKLEDQLQSQNVVKAISEILEQNALLMELRAALSSDHSLNALKQLTNEKDSVENLIKDMFKDEPERHNLKQILKTAESLNVLREDLRENRAAEDLRRFINKIDPDKALLTELNGGKLPPNAFVVSVDISEG
ncbi:MAG: hypothetical protein GYB31_08070 [Bacteroidetes bacterium]|nr:hypothetical protein [Bacteroidota bacterium]